MADYFTAAEVQALPDCADFSDEQVDSAAAFFVAIVEREVGRAFIPRTVTDTLVGDGSAALVLSQPYVQSLTTVTVGGEVVAVGDLSAEGGVLRYVTDDVLTSQVFPCGRVVVVTYTAGEYATCPDDIKDAVMWATRDRLLSQSETAGSWDRKTSVTNEFGTVQYALPGEKRPTGYPELDALIASYTRNTASFGFA